MIDYTTFEKLDLRVGTILSAKEFPEAKYPAYQLQIDFGPLGTLQSSAQITNRYTPADLINKQVIAVVNIVNFIIGILFNWIIYTNNIFTRIKIYNIIIKIQGS